MDVISGLCSEMRVPWESSNIGLDCRVLGEVSWAKIWGGKEDVTLKYGHSIHYTLLCFFYFPFTPRARNASRRKDKITQWGVIYAKKMGCVPCVARRQREPDLVGCFHCLWVCCALLLLSESWFLRISYWISCGGCLRFINPEEEYGGFVKWWLYYMLHASTTY